MAGLDTVEVCIDLERFGHPVLMGRLHRQQSGAGEIFSVEYDRAWLEQPEVFSLILTSLSPPVLSTRAAAQELRSFPRLVSGPMGQSPHAVKRARAPRKAQTSSPD
jgi:hypothetical protein